MITQSVSPSGNGLVYDYRSCQTRDLFGKGYYDTPETKKQQREQIRTRRAMEELIERFHESCATRNRG